MPIAVEMTFRGATLDQYDQVIESMGLVQGGPMPDGGISHWVTATDDGFSPKKVGAARLNFLR